MNIVVDPKTGNFIDEPNNSGSRVNYYLCNIDNPLREGMTPYIAECEDIINYLEMTWSEANMFKAIWRVASMRKNGSFKVGHDAKYDAEKILLYAKSNLKLVRNEKKKEE